MNAPTCSEEGMAPPAVMEVRFSLLLDDKLDGSTGGLEEGCSYGCSLALSFGSDDRGRTVFRPIPSGNCKQLLSRRLCQKSVKSALE